MQHRQMLCTLLPLAAIVIAVALAQHQKRT